MGYKHLFFDLDHTLWDFEANARLALEEVYEQLNLSSLGIDEFNNFYERYIYHNTRLWERYRKGYIKRDDLRRKRMWNTLLDFKIGNEKLAQRMDMIFLENLPTRKLLFPYTQEILHYLQDKGYFLHLITNGFESVQHAKLQNSGLNKFFQQVITSEGSNSLKPHKAIFDFALQKTGATLRESIMLGDDIDADIKGAQNAGMDQVFINHLQSTSSVQPTYMVNSLKELEEIF